MPGFELIGKEEQNEINDLFDKSGILFRHGFDNLRNGVYKVREFEKNFSKYMSVNDALAVTSGTAALKVALEALGIKRGDEVITSAFTFVATVEAIVETRAVPVIANIDKTLNISVTDIESKITSKTKAIIIIHMLGVATDMDAIIELANKHSLKVIEDTAWGCGGEYKGKKLGTIGDVGCYSFDFAKTMTTGEGGMIIARDHDVLERAKAFHDHGHENNPKLPRWEDSRTSSGFNFRMSEMQGAVGLAQLRKLDFIIEKQIENKNKIINALSNIKNQLFEFRQKPKDSKDTSEALIILTESNQKARVIRDKLLAKGYGTKILPEAITWHFAGDWDHITEIKQESLENIEESRALLSRCVALPIGVNMSLDFEVIKECFDND
jgi:8-amino-3,8-dideoxy-alpha-D-manno-octulosonate transaminase